MLYHTKVRYSCCGNMRFYFTPIDHINIQFSSNSLAYVRLFFRLSNRVHSCLSYMELNTFELTSTTVNTFTCMRFSEFKQLQEFFDRFICGCCRFLCWGAMDALRFIRQFWKWSQEVCIKSSAMVLGRHNWYLRCRNTENKTKMVY